MTTRRLTALFLLLPLPFACATDETAGDSAGSLADASTDGAADASDRSQADGSEAAAWDGRYPDVPEGYPPSECIPPCIWEALVACRVPELVERSCIWEPAPVPDGEAPRPDGTACSVESSVRLDVRTVIGESLGLRQRDTVFSYSLDETVCFRGEGVEFAVGVAIVYRYSDALGRTVAEHIIITSGRHEEYTQPTLVCGGGLGDPSSIPYPYSWSGIGPPENDPLMNPDCEPWLPYLRPRFIINASDICLPGTCSPFPSVSSDSGSDADEATDAASEAEP